MSASLPDSVARHVLDSFAIVHPAAQLQSLGNKGGFSGAQLWRVQEQSGAFVLKAWPKGGFDASRLRLIHKLMELARDDGLAFVPRVFQTNLGHTLVDHASRLWDLTSWMPGEVFNQRPSVRRLENACLALAQVHRAWAPHSPASGPCPGIQRRMEAIGQWSNLLRSGWQPSFALTPLSTVHISAERAWKVLSRWTERVPSMLAPWQDRRLPLQPCLCDIWHDHVLFTGDLVTGIIDYGALKADHIAVDLSRLLGSAVEDDEELRAAGLEAYSRLRPLSYEEQELVTVLDRTGTIIALTNWLTWLYRESRQFEDFAIVAERLGRLVERVEKWSAE